MEEIPSGPASQTPRRVSIWNAIHPRLLELIRERNSTILFVNSRQVAERLAGALNDLAGEPIARAHHGSLAAYQRSVIEEQLKAGQIRALCATSTLELGIDMGAVDLVIQIESPPSVASGMQRIGRAGHHVDAVSEGILFPKYRADLVACAAVTRAMHDGHIESTRFPRNPLDVLCQQLVAIVAHPPGFKVPSRPRKLTRSRHLKLGVPEPALSLPKGLDFETWESSPDYPAESAPKPEVNVDALYDLVRRAAPFGALTRSAFDGVLDLLSGRYPSDEFAELRPRLTWDRIRNVVTARDGAARLAILNAGTIPDRGLYGVFLAHTEGKVGACWRARRGDGLRVAPQRDLHPRRIHLAHRRHHARPRARGTRSRRAGQDAVLERRRPRAPARVRPAHRRAGPRASRAAKACCAHPSRRTSTILIPALRKICSSSWPTRRPPPAQVPDDRTIVIERTRDELGDWRVCVLTPFGSRIHIPWAMAVSARIRAAGGPEVETLWGDDGFVLRFPDTDEPPDPDWFLVESAEAMQLVLRQLGSTALFAGRFREAAGRALLLPRRRADQRSPLWQLRKRSYDLLSVASRYPSFPLLLEAYRECLRDVFDMPALIETLRAIEQRQLRVHVVETHKPSPFAASLLFSYVANFVYDGDAPLAERRAQALTIDQDQLRELLGEADLRELLDADAIAGS